MRTPFPGIQCHVSHVPLDAMQCWLGFFSSGYYCCVRMKYRGKLMRLGSSAWRQKIEKQGTNCEIIWPCMALRLGALDLLSQKDRTLDFEVFCQMGYSWIAIKCDLCFVAQMAGTTSIRYIWNLPIFMVMKWVSMILFCLVQSVWHRRCMETMRFQVCLAGWPVMQLMQSCRVLLSLARCARRASTCPLTRSCNQRMSSTFVSWFE